jgi:hypothetical protein
MGTGTFLNRNTVAKKNAQPKPGVFVITIVSIFWNTRLLRRSDG